MRVLRKIAAFWKRIEPSVLLIGAAAGVVCWIYANFATAAQLKDARDDQASMKAEMHAYVDQRHEELAGKLVDIKEELGKQRALQEKILIEVRH